MHLRELEGCVQGTRRGCGRGRHRGWSGCREVRAFLLAVTFTEAGIMPSTLRSPLPDQPPSPRVSSVKHQRVLASLGSAPQPHTQAAPAATLRSPDPDALGPIPFHCVFRFPAPHLPQGCAPGPSFTSCLRKAAPTLPFA